MKAKVQMGFDSFNHIAKNHLISMAYLFDYQEVSYRPNLLIFELIKNSKFGAIVEPLIHSKIASSGASNCQYCSY